VRAAEASQALNNAGVVKIFSLQIAKRGEKMKVKTNLRGGKKPSPSNLYLISG